MAEQINEFNEKLKSIFHTINETCGDDPQFREMCINSVQMSLQICSDYVQKTGKIPSEETWTREYFTRSGLNIDEIISGLSYSQDSMRRHSSKLIEVLRSPEFVSVKDKYITCNEYKCVYCNSVLYGCDEISQFFEDIPDFDPFKHYENLLHILILYFEEDDTKAIMNKLHEKYKSNPETKDIYQRTFDKVTKRYGYCDDFHPLQYAWIKDKITSSIS